MPASFSATACLRTSHVSKQSIQLTARSPTGQPTRKPSCRPGPTATPTRQPTRNPLTSIIFNATLALAGMDAVAFNTQGFAANSAELQAIIFSTLASMSFPVEFVSIKSAVPISVQADSPTLRPRSLAAAGPSTLILCSVGGNYAGSNIAALSILLATDLSATQLLANFQASSNSVISAVSAVAVRSITDSTAPASAPPHSSADDKKRLPVELIGAIFGGLLGVGVMLWLVYYVYKKRNSGYQYRREMLGGRVDYGGSTSYRSNSAASIYNDFGSYSGSAWGNSRSPERGRSMQVSMSSAQWGGSGGRL